jgi:hypothetical protein
MSEAWCHDTIVLLIVNFLLPLSSSHFIFSITPFSSLSCAIFGLGRGYIFYHIRIRIYAMLGWGLCRLIPFPFLFLSFYISLYIILLSKAASYASLATAVSVYCLWLDVLGIELYFFFSMYLFLGIYLVLRWGFGM